MLSFKSGGWRTRKSECEESFVLQSVNRSWSKAMNKMQELICNTLWNNWGHLLRAYDKWFTYIRLFFFLMLYFKTVCLRYVISKARLGSRIISWIFLESHFNSYSIQWITDESLNWLLSERTTYNKAWGVFVMTTEGNFRTWASMRTRLDVFMAEYSRNSSDIWIPWCCQWTMLVRMQNLNLWPPRLNCGNSPTKINNNLMIHLLN